MKSNLIKIIVPVACGLFAFCTVGSAQEKVDAVAIQKIRTEGLNHSKVMEYAFYLTDVSGPRLTASPGFYRAANWVKDELIKIGAENARLEPWGKFGTGWQQTHCYIAMTAPYYSPLIGQARAWTSSTAGKAAIKKEVMLISAKDSVELYSNYGGGKIKDQVVMIYAPDTVQSSATADFQRYADTALESMKIERPDRQRRPDTSRMNQSPQVMALRQRLIFNRQVTEFFRKEKPALVLSMNHSGNNGTVFVSNGGSYDENAVNYPNVLLSSDDFLRIQRLAKAEQQVEIEADVKTAFTPVINAENVLAEIPGSDPVLKNEVVMIGGHLDSWQAATGATDNAAGCAVMMEVMRILKTTGLQPARTIRIALWSGEEEGLLGSRAYVKNHIADPTDMVLKPDHKNIVAYYNLDNGGGKIRGIYTQGNKEAAPIFAEWLKPFYDIGATTVSPNNTGSTDHVSFDAVGVPGFQFIQDPMDYFTRTHHTNMDTYDHLVPADLQQAATVIASFVYETAQRKEPLPRKPLPAARPATTGLNR